MNTTNKNILRQRRISHLFQKFGQPKSCYYDYQLMDADEQRFIEHVLTTINTKGYMPA